MSLAQERKPQIDTVGWLFLAFAQIPHRAPAAPCASRYPGPGPIGPSDASRFRYRKACDASRLGHVVTVTRHEFGVTRHNQAAVHAKSFLGIAGRVGVIGLDRRIP